jgi:hypothetical protein
MIRYVLVTSVVAAVLASTGVAMAQGEAKQPPAEQTAPSDHAPGHDAQSGKPETGEKRHNDNKKGDGSGQSDRKDKKSTMPK